MTGFGHFHIPRLTSSLSVSPQFLHLPLRMSRKRDSRTSSMRPSWPPLSLQKCPEGGSVGSCDSEQGSLFQDLPPNIPPQYLGIGPSLKIWPQPLCSRSQYL